MSAIMASGISKSFGDDLVLDNLDFQAEAGRLTAIMGPSGVGKTTLLRILGGLEQPDSGSVSILGRELEYGAKGSLEQRRRMALVTQKPVAFRDTVLSNVAYPLMMRGADDAEELALEALEQVNLREHARKPARKLSGGEMQRMAFARATVFQPDILMLDEFTSHLDPYNIRLLEDAMLHYMRERNAAIIMVTHNLFQARRISTEAALLLDGRIVETGPTERIFTEPADSRTGAFVRGDMVF